MSAPPRSAGPSSALVYLLMGFLCLAWGSTWLVIKIGLAELAPLFGAGIRFVLAGALVALLAPWLVPIEGGARPPRGAVLAHSLCQFVLNYAIVYFSETVLPSGLVSVLWSVYPLFVALAGHFVLGSERLGLWQWLGILTGLSGIVTLFATDVASISREAVGTALPLLLAPASVTFSTYVVKLRAAGSSSILLNRDSMLLGGMLLLVMSLLVEREQRLPFTAVALGSVAYLAVVGSVLTFGVYMWLLRYVAAYRLSLVSYGTPLLALWVGATFGGEPLSATTLAGTALVVAGVALTLRRPWLAPGREPATVERGKA